jgi:ankyrin repeat protein
MARVRELLDARPELVNELANDPQPPSAAGEHNRDRPITTAAQHERMEIARLLLDRGADPNGGTPLWAPQGQALFAACARGNVEMATMLLEAGANPNVKVERQLLQHHGAQRRGDGTAAA